MTGPPALDPIAFRNFFGFFATGVTVLTTSNHGKPLGMTANAVSSLSLDPMLLLVCIDQGASVHRAVQDAGSFALNILAEDQQHLSTLFASHGEPDEPLGGVAHHSGLTGAPLLDGTLAWVECELRERFRGGDHTIFVGEPVAFEVSRPEAAPLLFFLGQYRSIAAAR